jgi:hypothetical protein
MEDTGNPLFSDKLIIPSEDIIFPILGNKKELWKILMTYMKDNYANSSGEWNYYNDGKRWLFKMIWKKKTVFWINITESTFRVTFWFSDKAEPIISGSDLPEVIINDFKTSKKYGAVRALSVLLCEMSDIENVLKLIPIKTAMK